MKNLITKKQGGLKCDSLTCDWQDLDIKIDNYAQWLNAPCPKCGQNLLTTEDYNNVLILLATVDYMNGLSAEQVEMLASEIETAAQLTSANLAQNPVLGEVDVKYLGIPNICFSITDKDDKREIDFIKQRLERGFDDSETWSLRDSISLFILPRLKRYQEIANDFLKRDDNLVNDIDCFIKAMELVSRDNGSCIHTPQEEKQMVEGLDKFPKVFMSLWW